MKYYIMFIKYMIIVNYLGRFNRFGEKVRWEPVRARVSGV